MLQIFQEGGFAMYWILYLGVAGLALAVVNAVIARKGMFIVAAIMFALVIGVAAFGTMDGRRKVEDGALGLENEPDLKARMLAQGYKEAMRPAQFVGIVVVPGCAMLIVGEVRRRRRRHR